MTVDIVATDSAPQAIGPYSQAVVAGDLMFLSGQIPLDPVSMEIVGDGDPVAQTAQVMKNLSAVLAAQGASLANLVKTTIYLQSMGDFAVVNEAYAAALQGHRPARATVEVAALPKGVLVEIDGIAHIPS